MGGRCSRRATPRRSIPGGVEERIAQSETERQRAETQRQELAAEIARVETKYDGTSDADSDSLGVTTSLQRLELIGARKGRVEEELREHDDQIAAFESQL